jgi:DNA (cytosine-5)-methyltransferase 1
MSDEFCGWWKNKETMNELALFAGAGGGILGGHLLGWRTVAAVEFNAYCARRLMQRQNEGHLAPFPIWDDVRTFDGRHWRGLVDVVSGGFPCQDISIAGGGAGLGGERSGLWLEMARIVCEVRPDFVYVENSPMLIDRGLDRVLGDLATMGFDARWGVLGADDLGAPQHRERIWILADAHHAGREGAERPRQSHQARHARETSRRQLVRPDRGYWPPGPREVHRIPVSADGVANRVDRLRAIGNGQVPCVAASAWRLLMPQNTGAMGREASA